jgi:flagella basal body P-ring formation protein FlgA
VGQFARTNLRAGALAHRSSLQPPKLVTRGQRVTIIYQSGALRVTAQGESVIDGVEGQWVPVKNLSSGKSVKARVVAPGLVQVR